MLIILLSYKAQETLNALPFIIYGPTYIQFTNFSLQSPKDNQCSIFYYTRLKRLSMYCLLLYKTQVTHIVLRLLYKPVEIHDIQSFIIQDPNDTQCTSFYYIRLNIHSMHSFLLYKPQETLNVQPFTIQSPRRIKCTAFYYTIQTMISNWCHFPQLVDG